jgi:hypothetical protein
MSGTRLRLRLTSSETRDLADRAIAESRLAETDTWPMNDTAFFAAFVVLAAALAIAALVLR